MNNTTNMTTLNNNLTEEDEDLRCPICNHFFTQINKPYLLPCNHNICLKCIDNLKAKYMLFCPICRRDFKVDHSFQVNYSFLNLVIKILKHKTIFCNSCKRLYQFLDHYTTCDPINFIESVEIFSELKDLVSSCLGFFNNIESKILLVNDVQENFKEEYCSIKNKVIETMDGKFCFSESLISNINSAFFEKVNQMKLSYEGYSLNSNKENSNGNSNNKVSNKDYYDLYSEFPSNYKSLIDELVSFLQLSVSLNIISKEEFMKVHKSYLSSVCLFDEIEPIDFNDNNNILNLNNNDHIRNSNLNSFNNINNLSMSNFNNINNINNPNNNSQIIRSTSQDKALFGRRGFTSKGKNNHSNNYNYSNYNNFNSKYYERKGTFQLVANSFKKINLNNIEVNRNYSTEKDNIINRSTNDLKYLRHSDIQRFKKLRNYNNNTSETKLANVSNISDYVQTNITTNSVNPFNKIISNINNINTSNINNNNGNNRSRSINYNDMLAFNHNNSYNNLNNYSNYYSNNKINKNISTITNNSTNTNNNTNTHISLPTNNQKSKSKVMSTHYKDKSITTPVNERTRVISTNLQERNLNNNNNNNINNNFNSQLSYDTYYDNNISEENTKKEIKAIQLSGMPSANKNISESKISRANIIEKLNLIPLSEINQNHSEVNKINKLYISNAKNKNDSSNNKDKNKNSSIVENNLSLINKTSSLSDNTLALNKHNNSKKSDINSNDINKSNNNSNISLNLSNNKKFFISSNNMEKSFKKKSSKNNTMKDLIIDGNKVNKDDSNANINNINNKNNLIQEINKDFPVSTKNNKRKITLRNRKASYYNLSNTNKINHGGFEIKIGNSTNLNLNLNVNMNSNQSMMNRAVSSRYNKTKNINKLVNKEEDNEEYEEESNNEENIDIDDIDEHDDMKNEFDNNFSIPNTERAINKISIGVTDIRNNNYNISSLNKIKGESISDGVDWKDEDSKTQEVDYNSVCYNNKNTNNNNAEEEEKEESILITTDSHNIKNNNNNNICKNQENLQTQSTHKNIASISNKSIDNMNINTCNNENIINNEKDNNSQITNNTNNSEEERDQITPNPELQTLIFPTYEEAFNKVLQIYNKIKDTLIKLKLEQQVLEEAYMNMKLQLNRNFNQNKNTLEKTLSDIFDNLNQNISYKTEYKHRTTLCNFFENSKKIWLFNILKFKSEVRELDINFKFSNGMGIEINNNGSIVYLSGGVATGNSSSSNTSFFNFFSNDKENKNSKKIVINYNPEKDDSFSNMLLIYYWDRNIIDILKMTHKKAFHSSLFNNNKLFIIGGCSNFSTSSKECICYNTAEKCWELLPNLNHSRANPALCLYNANILYCFRGYQNETNRTLDSIEWVNIDTIEVNPKWNLFIPEDPGLSWNKLSCSTALVLNESQIFIFGGCDGLARESKGVDFSKSCFIFNPITKSVYKSADLYKAAVFNTCCTYKEHSNSIVAIDYRNESNKLFGIHSFSFDSKKWKFIS